MHIVTRYTLAMMSLALLGACSMSSPSNSDVCAAPSSECEVASPLEQNWNAEKAWYSAREAVKSVPNDLYAAMYFWDVYNHYVVDGGWSQLGTSMQDVVDHLGEPDSTIESENGKTFVVYGLCKMQFADGKLEMLLEVQESN